MCEDFNSIKCSTNGLSVACIDAGTNTLAGVLWVRDFKQPLEDEDMYKSIVELLPCISPVVSIVQLIEDIYTSQRPDITGKGQCAVLMLLGVHPSFRRRGIANRLTSFACRHLKEIGYKYVILESSGAYSAKCAEGVGMKSIVSKEYSQCSEVFRGIPREHSCMTLWEIESKDID